jgi:hypothetical protein
MRCCTTIPHVNHMSITSTFAVKKSVSRYIATIDKFRTLGILSPCILYLPAVQPRLSPRPAVLSWCIMVACLIPNRNTATTTNKPVEAAAMNRLKQAAGHTKDVANLPPRLLGMYTDFITKNAGAVGQVEGALRSLTYIIPGILLRTVSGHHTNTDRVNRPLPGV